MIPAARRINREGSTGPLHTLRIVYRAHITGGRLRHEKNGSTDRADWFALSRLRDIPRVKLIDIALKMAGER